MEDGRTPKIQIDPPYNWRQGTRGLQDQAKKNKQKKTQKNNHESSSKISN